MWTAISMTVALAGTVDVSDESGCLELEFVELELERVVSRSALDEVGVTVQVAAVDDTRVATLSVRSNRPVWERELSIGATDCPDLPTLVAASVERGLAEIEGLGVERTRREGLPLVAGAELGPSVGVGVLGPRATLTVLAEAEVPWALRLAARGELGLPEEVGAGTASVRVAQLGLGVGPAAPRRAVALRPLGTVWAGVAGAYGAGFDTNLSGTTPRASMGARGELLLRWIVVSLGAEVPMPRVALAQSGRPDMRIEAPLRIDLAVGMRTISSGL